MNSTYLGEIELTEETLAHYGVKGMRWGVRKERNIGGMSKRKQRKLKYGSVDPTLAKNKTTRRVAYDYHNMSKAQFAGKYKTSKRTFQKRYIKSEGDTYSMGKRKNAVALAILTAAGHPLKALKSATYDYGTAFLGTNVGYKKAAQRFDEGHPTSGIKEAERNKRRGAKI